MQKSFFIYCATLYTNTHMSSRAPRQTDILPQKWEDLNKKLHGYYGYSPDLQLHPKVETHLAQLKTFVSDDHPDAVLIQNWIDDIIGLLYAKTKATNLLSHSSDESDGHVSEELAHPPLKRQKSDDPGFLAQSTILTPAKTPTLKNRKRKNDEPEIIPTKIGYDYVLENLTSKKEYPPQIDFQNIRWWSGDGGKTMELKSIGNAEESTILVLFGKIKSSAFGIYGDFNPTYHESLVEGGNRLLTLRLAPVEGFVDEFVRQSEAIRRMENLLNDRFDETTAKHRAVKNPQELQISRRLIDRAKKGSFIPQEEPGIKRPRYFHRYRTEYVEQGQGKRFSG